MEQWCEEQPDFAAGESLVPGVVAQEISFVGGIFFRVLICESITMLLGKSIPFAGTLKGILEFEGWLWEAGDIRACSHYRRDSMMKDHVQSLEARKDATKGFQASKRSTWLRHL